MSEQMGSGPDEARRRLVERSMQDEVFRQRLLSDPKGTVEDELGASLPEETEIHVVEETSETVYLVLPPRAVTRQSGELSDRELEAVAGGWERSGEKGAVTGYSTVTCVGAACGFTDE